MKKIQLGGYRSDTKFKGYALVDDVDFDLVSKHKWHSHEGYAMTNVYKDKKTTLVRMHHLIIGKSKGLDIDHINRNRADNQRSNLRIVTRSENLRNGVNPLNTSGFRGLYWHKSAKKWCAEFKINKKKVYLGLFNSKENAIKILNLAKVQYGY
jgi:hypothetical protein